MQYFITFVVVWLVGAWPLYWWCEIHYNKKRQYVEVPPYNYTNQQIRFYIFWPFVLILGFGFLLFCWIQDLFTDIDDWD